MIYIARSKPRCRFRATRFARSISRLRPSNLACFWVVSVVDTDLDLGLELTALQEDLDLSLALEANVSN